MTDVLTDTSDNMLYQKSLEHFFESMTCFSVVEDAEVIEQAEMTCVISPGIPNWLTNAVFNLQFSENDPDKQIDEINAYYRARGVVPFWRICPGYTPTDLEEQFVAKGFELKMTQFAMAVDIRELNQNIKVPDDFVIERMTSAEELRSRHPFFSRVTDRKSFGGLLLNLFDAYGYDLNSAWQNYVGFLNGKAVSYSAVFYATGVAGIYSVGTLPEARGLGIGTAITRQPLLDALDKGYVVGMLQSSEMGRNMYLRLGFKEFFPIKYYTPPQ